jgi:SAM-dependent methyltransferase
LRLWYSFVRFAFRHFYNEFAWTYDWVSRIVSRGRWHDWQRAALPELRGQRVLEVAFGTGNLLWDMVAEGYLCVGVERSPYMASITARTHPSAERSFRVCPSPMGPSTPWSLPSLTTSSWIPLPRERWHGCSCLEGDWSLWREGISSRRVFGVGS